jgi:hypothetical protein
MATSIAKLSTTSRHPAPQRAGRIPYRPIVYNKRSRQRFERDRRAQILDHLGRDPTEWLLVGRVIAIEFELQKYDAKMIAGEELSGHLLRARLAAENRLRLDLVALGLSKRDTESEQPIATLHRHLRRRGPG